MRTTNFATIYDDNHFWRYIVQFHIFASDEYRYYEARISCTRYNIVIYGVNYWTAVIINCTLCRGCKRGSRTSVSVYTVSRSMSCIPIQCTNAHVLAHVHTYHLYVIEKQDYVHVRIIFRAVHHIIYNDEVPRNITIVIFIHFSHQIEIYYAIIHSANFIYTYFVIWKYYNTPR